MKSVRAVAVLVVALSSGVIPASAQTPRPERPYRGLFGGGVGNAEQLLTIGGSLGGGYDDSIPVDPLEGVDSGQRFKGGWYTQAAAGLKYSLERQKIAFGASVATLGRYYPADLREIVGTHSASVGVVGQVARHTQVQVSQVVARQPYFVLSLFPVLFDPGVGQVAVPSFDFGTRREHYFSYTSAATVSQTLPHRASLRAGYRYTGTEFSSSANRFVAQMGDVGFLMGLKKGLALKFGYGLIEGRYASRVWRSQTIDAGVDFNRALSVSRRTTLAFSTGTAAVSDGERTAYRLTGGARLIREIGRTWNAALAYDRSVGFWETLQEPIFADRITVGVNGLITRRVEFRSSAGVSIGDVGFVGDQRGFSSQFAMASIGTAITRRLEFGVQYAFYRHLFDSAAALPVGFPLDLDRQTVRAYITVWQPLFFRARRPPDATR